MKNFNNYQLNKMKRNKMKNEYCMKSLKNQKIFIKKLFKIMNSGLKKKLIK